MPSGPWSRVTGIMSGQRGGGRRGRTVVGCRGLKRELIQMFILHSFYILLRALMCPWWPGSFSVEWNILHSSITVQMGLMRDTEGLGIISRVTSEFLRFSTYKCFQIWILSHCWGQCVTQRVCGRRRSDSTTDSTHSVDTWKEKQTVSLLSLNPFLSPQSSDNALMCSDTYFRIGHL